MADEKKKTSEEKITASKYLMSFSDYISEMQEQYANYLNFLMYLGNKYSEKTIIEWEEKDRQDFVELVQSTRYYATNAYLKFKGMEKILKLSEDITKSIEAHYAPLKQNFIFKSADMESFVITFNEMLTQSVVKSMLETANEVMQELYGTEKPQAQEATEPHEQ